MIRLTLVTATAVLPAAFVVIACQHGALAAASAAPTIVISGLVELSTRAVAPLGHSGPRESGARSPFPSQLSGAVWRRCVIRLLTIGATAPPTSNPTTSPPTNAQGDGFSSARPTVAKAGARRRRTR